MNNIDYNKDYYSILGVKEDATQDDIKKQFRKLSRETHPDLHPNDKECEEKFKAYSEAYEILSSKEKKEEYDNVRKFGSMRGHRMGGFGPMGMDDVHEFMRRHGFSQDFQTPQPHFDNHPRYGQDIHIEVELPFEDFFFGCSKTLDIKVKNKCKHCTNGLTGAEPEFRKCPKCHGQGMIVERRGNMIMQHTCDNCMGSGQIVGNKCPHCNGTSIDGTRTQSVIFDIPKFSYSGFSTKYDKIGHCGVYGGKSGDITITARMSGEGRFFLAYPLRGDTETLKTFHFVPILKGLIGGTEKILTPYGYVDYEIPPMKESQIEVTIPKKGLKKKDSSENADLIVVIAWDIPSSIDKKESDGIKKVLKLMGERDNVYKAVEELKKFDKNFADKLKEEFPNLK